MHASRGRAGRRAPAPGRRRLARTGEAPGRRAAAAAAGGDPRRARHGRARLDPRQARGVRGADEVGLNTIELDVKDEGGEIGFNPSGVALARKAGAVPRLLRPAQGRARDAPQGHLPHRACRRVPGSRTSPRARPDMAIRRPDGSIWATSAGLEWVEPVRPARVGLRRLRRRRCGAGRLRRDHVRLRPLPDRRRRRAAATPADERPKGRTIANFAAYARQRLAPLGVRVSVDVFGLSATRDMGIGQVPAPDRPGTSTQVYPMVVPVALRGGRIRHRIDPSAEPGETVFRSLIDFKREFAAAARSSCRGSRTCSYRTRAGDVQQIRAARLQGTKGFLLWNAAGIYTKSALAPPLLTSGTHLRRPRIRFGSDGGHAHDRAPHRDPRARAPGRSSSAKERAIARPSRLPADLRRASRERDDHRRRRQHVHRLRRRRRRRQRRARPPARRRGGRRSRRRGSSTPTSRSSRTSRT